MRLANLCISLWLAVVVACGASTPLEDAGADGDPDLGPDADRTDADRSDADRTDAARTDADRPDDGDGPEPGCPPEMVLQPGASVCIDRWEASMAPGGGAASVAGVEPWVLVTWAEAAEACEAAGKRLCRAGEWTGACQGPRGLAYPYGDVYEPHSCNGSDHDVGVAMLTGSVSGCEGGYPGLFDMSGNVWEWIDSCIDDLCRVRGGSFNRHEDGLQCTSSLGFDRGERYAALGFRCCLDPSR